ncbi:hypothetical protein M407DRAFT_26493 [Tulasnella calospora MUT 4182]|uniref:Uncharacterized protein n=1 Tax=Tulasnella calospora MUT 4182 TaxID=1051891 RepID=A0A0C3QFP4_9AGAM|nr:hypothetical protein M407DRAFT_26493 [Tulasnella calospora MUT 4182]
MVIYELTRIFCVASVGDDVIDDLTFRHKAAEETPRKLMVELKCEAVTITYTGD